MPILALAPAAATAFWSAVGAGAVASSNIVGAKMSSNASKRAGQVQADAAAKAEAFAEKQDALDRSQYATEYARQIAVQDEQLQQARDDRARRQALIDQMGAARGGFTGGAPSSTTLAQLAPSAQQLEQTALPATPPPMPHGWKPGDPIPRPVGAPSTTTPIPPTGVPIPTSLADLSPALKPTDPSVSPVPVAQPMLPPGGAAINAVARPDPYTPIIPRRVPMTLAALRGGY